MRFIGSIIEQLQRHPKRIVFPEGQEPRVLQAARQFQALRLGVPILLGDRTRIKDAASALGYPQWDPSDRSGACEDLDSFVNIIFSSGKTRDTEQRALLDPNCAGR